AAQAHAEAEAAEKAGEAALARVEKDLSGTVKGGTDVKLEDIMGPEVGRSDVGPTTPVETKQELGAMLQAIGKNRHTLAPIGTEETGVSAAADRLKTQVRNSYEEANVIATNKGLALPIPSGQVADLQREADDFLELTIKHSASPAERRLANNLAELGGPVHIAKDTG